MSIESWDYIDPSIARKYMSICSSISSLQKEIQSIRESDVINSSLKYSLVSKKQKLLNEHTAQLQAYKLNMIDYYDQQTSILSKDVHLPHRLPVPVYLNPTKSLIDDGLNESTIENSKIANHLDITVKSVHKQAKIANSNRRLKENLKRIIRFQSHKISRLQSQLKEKEQNFKAEDQSSLEQRTILYSKEKSEENEELIRLLRAKLSLMESHYKKRQQSIEQYWIQKFNNISGNAKNIC